MCVCGGGGGGVAGNEVGFLIMVEVVVFGHKAREKKFYSRLYGSTNIVYLRVTPHFNLSIVGGEIEIV